MHIADIHGDVLLFCIDKFIYIILSKYGTSVNMI